MGDVAGGGGFGLRPTQPDPLTRILWKSDLAVRVDIFNVTNEQRTTAVDQTYNTVDTAPHQNYPYFKMETEHQQARRVRLAIRWTF